MNNKYIISKENLNKLLSERAKVLVGVVMKRFEVLDDDEKYHTKSIAEKNYRKDLKHLIKEQIYEEFRNLRSLIITFSSGINFITKQDPKQD